MIKKIESKKIKIASLVGVTALLFLFTFAVIQSNKQQDLVQASSTSTLSNKKIGWGIKREDNHKQPDLGSVNKRIIEKYDGICMGNPELPYVYLTFDNGYEAGYTEKILAVLKENEVPAAFFITGHYVNSQPQLVEKMINEGHIVRKSFLKHNYVPEIKIDVS